MAEDADVDAFVQWFQSNGGYFDTKVMGITEFPDSGRGGIALCDIPEGHTLFTLPRVMTLSTQTSPLPSLFGLDAWRVHGLHRGWVGLILCMMWEDAWTHESDMVDEVGQCQGGIQTKWGPYMRTLPTTFDTPMFWSVEELEELRGTAVVGKIGRDDAEREYSEKLVPAIRASPTLFPPSHHGKWYTLDAYHRAGSRILSRSFTVTRWTNDDGVEENEDHNGETREGGSDAGDAEDPHANTSIGSSMHIDDGHPHPSVLEGTNEGRDSDSENDEQDDPSDITMVPMADILNARWGSENAKLFHEPIVLRMVTTKNIRQGEQIFNTYGDLPNSDLLRRYGHVDLVRLPSSSSAPTSDRDGDMEMEEGITNVETILHYGNPSDVTEIRADLIVDVIQTSDLESQTKDVRERIEWWLDEGEDDAFVLSLPDSGSDLSAILPPGLVSLTRLLMLSEHNFNSARSKGKLPKGDLKKIDMKETKQVLEIMDEVIKQREGMYIGGSVEDDERLLFISDTLSKRERHAAIVRLGEKRILRDTRQALRVTLAKLSVAGGAGSRNKDDAKKGDETSNTKKRVANRVDGDHGRKKPRK